MIKIDTINFDAFSYILPLITSEPIVAKPETSEWETSEPNVSAAIDLNLSSQRSPKSISQSKNFAQSNKVDHLKPISVSTSAAIGLNSSSQGSLSLKSISLSKNSAESNKVNNLKPISVSAESETSEPNDSAAIDLNASSQRSPKSISLSKNSAESNNVDNLKPISDSAESETSEPNDSVAIGLDSSSQRSLKSISLIKNSVQSNKVDPLKPIFVSAELEASEPIVSAKWKTSEPIVSAKCKTSELNVSCLPDTTESAVDRMTLFSKYYKAFRDAQIFWEWFPRLGLLNKEMYNGFKALKFRYLVVRDGKLYDEFETLKKCKINLKDFKGLERLKFKTLELFLLQRLPDESSESNKKSENTKSNKKSESTKSNEKSESTKSNEKSESTKSDEKSESTKSYLEILCGKTVSEITESSKKMQSMIRSLQPNILNLMPINKCGGKDITQEPSPEAMVWAKTLIYLYQFYRHHKPQESKDHKPQESKHHKLQKLTPLETHPQFHLANLFYLARNFNPTCNTSSFEALLKLFFHLARDPSEELYKQMRTAIIMWNGVSEFDARQNEFDTNVITISIADVLTKPEWTKIEKNTSEMLKILIHNGFDVKNKKILNDLYSEYTKTLKEKSPNLSSYRKMEDLLKNGASPIFLTTEIQKLNERMRKKIKKLNNEVQKPKKNDKTDDSSAYFIKNSARLIDLFSPYFQVDDTSKYLIDLFKNKLNDYRQQASFNIKGGTGKIAKQESGIDLSQLTKFIHINTIHQFDLQERVSAIHKAETAAEVLKECERILISSGMIPKLKKLIVKLSKTGLDNKVALFHYIVFNGLILPLIRDKNYRILKKLFSIPNRARAFSPEIQKGYQSLCKLLCPVTTKEFESLANTITVTDIALDLRLFSDMNEILSDEKIDQADLFNFINNLRDLKSEDDFIELVKSTSLTLDAFAKKAIISTIKLSSKASLPKLKDAIIITLSKQIGNTLRDITGAYLTALNTTPGR